MDFNLTQERTRECIRTRSLVFSTIVMKYQVALQEKTNAKKVVVRPDIEKHVLCGRLLFYHQSCYAIDFIQIQPLNLQSGGTPHSRKEYWPFLALKLSFVQSSFASEQT